MGEGCRDDWTSLDSVSHSTLCHADIPEHIDVALVKCDPQFELSYSMSVIPAPASFPKTAVVLSALRPARA